MDAPEYLKKPYARLVTPDSDGSFFAEVLEFPGCFATGKSAGEAFDNLESVAVDWINAALAQGQDIPEPMEVNEHSGKTVLRMTKGLHKRAALWAEREGVSLNQFINTCLAEAVGERARMMAPRPQLQAVATLSFQLVPTAIGGASIAHTPAQGITLPKLGEMLTASGSKVFGVPFAPLRLLGERRDARG